MLDEAANSVNVGLVSQVLLKQAVRRAQDLRDVPSMLLRRQSIVLLHAYYDLRPLESWARDIHPLCGKVRFNRTASQDDIGALRPLERWVVEVAAPVRVSHQMKWVGKEDVIKAFLEATGMPRNDLFFGSRVPEVVLPRQLCMYLINHDAKHRTGLPYSKKQIGDIFGRERTTVISALEKISSLLERDTHLQELVAKTRRLYRI